MMKWKTKLLPLLMALLLIFNLTACGASAAPAEDAITTEPMAAPEMEMDYGYYNGAVDGVLEDAVVEEEGYSTAENAAGEVPDGGTEQAVAETKLVYRATMEAEALDFDAAVAALDELVEKLGGYYEFTSLDSYSNRRYASYTIRIPSGNYDTFVEAWSESDNCQLNYITEAVEDIGAAYFDVETRLTTLRTNMDRLQALLAEATLMEDIITIESAISETEYEIERYTSTLNRYDSLVGFATINLNLAEVIQLTETKEEAYLSRLTQELRWGLEDFVDELEDLSFWLAYNLIGVIIFAVVLVVVIRCVLRKKREGKMRISLKKKTEETAENTGTDK